ncbi:MAG: ATP synthase F1 subunit delta [Bacteroidetes bacterium 4484_276]|nr:MAG: ATP synthase F1 subunit delta [Bacteroidetes bacterium 4484_276]
MDFTIISQRYAKALFELALEMKILDRVNQDMLLVQSVTVENPEFKRLLASPIIPPGKKSQIIKGIFEKHLERLSFRFLQLVVKKEREAYLQNIAESFISMYKKFNNILPVKLTTAQPIDDEIRREMLILLKDATHKKIELEEKVEENLIGGFVLNLDDSQYDASLRKKISRLQKAFESNLYVKGF